MLKLLIVTVTLATLVLAPAPVEPVEVAPFGVITIAELSGSIGD